MTRLLAGLGLVLLVAGAQAQDDDYWAEDYDSEKNCESETLISDIEKNPKAQCVSNTIQNSSQAIEYCKKELSTYLFSACSPFQPLKSGELLYCYERTKTTCCFHNHDCMETWTAIGKNYEQVAVDFMKNPETSLEVHRIDQNFNTCHLLKDSYDATVCAEDCKALETNSTLATDCKAKGGLFKCCIRRDKMNCHECRFCCTLPFCTYEGENGVRSIGEESLHQLQEQKNQEHHLKAIQLLEAENAFYKGEDTRCLMPYSDPDPNKWGHYDPDHFANIILKEELDKAEPVEFDKRFFNLEDPEVFEMMTGKKFKQNFQEAYGYDFVAQVMDPYNSTARCISESQMFECSKNCLEAEKSKFAKDCRRDKGLFKCCVNTLDLSTFPDTRKTLKKEGLISSEVTDACLEDGKTNKCYVCTASYFCTKKNIFTGNLSHSFMTPEVNVLGGNILLELGGGPKDYERFGFRNSYCLKQDYCSMSESMYNFDEFVRATTPEHLCQAQTDVVDENHLECNKQMKAEKKVVKKKGLKKEKSCGDRWSNVRICPKKKNPIDNPYLEKVNRVLKKIRHTDKKKKKKKKNMKKKKKKGVKKNRKKNKQKMRKKIKKKKKRASDE